MVGGTGTFLGTTWREWSRGRTAPVYGQKLLEGCSRRAEMAHAPREGLLVTPRCDISQVMLRLLNTGFKMDAIFCYNMNLQRMRHVSGSGVRNP